MQEPTTEFVRPCPVERRSQPRFPFCVEVDVTSEHNFYTGFSQDISEGGLFISTFHLLEVGEQFELSFVLPGALRPINVVCEVRWIRTYNPKSDAGPGMGVRFCNLLPAFRLMIQQYISQHPSIFFA